MAKPEIGVSDRHLRAICAEIGDRLRQYLDKTTQEPSARLAAVLLRFEELDEIEAPSIVPSLEVADEGLQTDCSAVVGF